MTPAGQFATATITLLAVVDPIGTSAIYIGLAQTEIGAWTTALRAVTIATAILLAAAILAARIDASSSRTRAELFAVAGCVLVATAVFARSRPRCGSIRRIDPSLVPLSFPLLAGPGCIATTLALAAERNGDAVARCTVPLAVLTVETTALVALLTAARLARLMTPAILSRISLTARILLAGVGLKDIVEAVSTF